MISEILKIRIKQIGRIINDIGLLRFLVIAFFLGTVIFLAYMATNNPDGSIIISLVSLASLFYLHIKRSDALFLKSHVEHYILLQVIEYMALSLPVLAGLAIHGQLILLTAFTAAVIMMIFFTRPFRRRTVNTFIQKYILSGAYEWKSGIRKSVYWLMLLWIVAFSTSFWLGSVPVAIVIFGLVTLGFMDKNEPLPYVLAFEKPPLQFLSAKMKIHLLLFTLPLIPLIIIFLIFHAVYWYLAILTYLLLAFIHAYAILCKYSFYVPNTRSGGQPFNMLGFAGVLLPFLLPLVIVLTIRFYFRSIDNLKQYLHDYH